MDYVAPKPMGMPLLARGVIEEITERKVVTAISVTADGILVATGRVVAVRMPQSLTRS